jgi:lysophospholipase
LLVRVGLGRLGASGRRGWRRDGPDDLARGLTHDAWRGRVQQSWAIANPDLRMSGQSPGWRNAFALAGRQAQEGARTVAAPVLMLSPSGEATGPVALCAAPPRCERRVIDGARPALQLEIDSRRKVWMDDVAAFVERPAHPPTTAPPPAG